MNRFPDRAWEIAADHYERCGHGVATDELRQAVEAQADIRIFDWGVIVVVPPNMLDVYVYPEAQNKKLARPAMEAVLKELLEKNGKVESSIHKDNKPSLRLAELYGFVKVGEDGDDILLEKYRE